MINRITGVLCCGNISYDIPVWPLDEVPWGRSIWVEELTFSVGGNGATTSYSMAKLGGSVRLTGIVGNDPQGDAILAMLRGAGVQLDIRRTDAPTTSTIVLVQSSSDRSFLHRPGASRDLGPDVMRYEAPGYSHFHLANPFSLPNIRPAGGDMLRAAKQAGLTTSMDTAWDAKNRWMVDIGPCLPYTDLLFVNDAEAKMLTGSDVPAEAATVLRSHGATDIVIKVGPRGCVVFVEDEQFEAPGFSVKAKDTTGAGDCFVGGFLASLQRGLSYPLAARVANAAGAMNVQKLGAAQGVCNWEETQAWIAERNTL